MKKIAIIPARGGSKRIPRKNIKAFLGKPIITYSIQTAIDSGLYDEVMVSTDDKEIAQIALENGAKVPFIRSSENANDFATTADVILEVLAEYKKKGQKFDYCTCIYPTAPFVTAELLKRSLDKLLFEKFDSVFPVLKYSFPIQRAMRADDSGRIRMIDEEHMHLRSQDLEPSFHDSGQFYTLNVNVFLNEQKLWTSNTGFIEISELEAQDIDNETDWKLAELKYELRRNQQNNSI